MTTKAEARRPTLPGYVLITPARNEEANLPRLIDSVTRQTVLPLRWIIVNDGSTDRTGEIVEQAAAQHAWIRVVDMPLHRDRSFAAKVHSFEAGRAALEPNLDYHIIGNLDADLSFEEDYLEFLLEKFASMPELGVAGTTFREDGGYDSAVDSFEGERHVAGGCQLFRGKCFEEIGGFVPNPAGGVDWIAVTTARLKGWKTQSFREKWFYHHRSLGTAERSVWQSNFSYGEKDYYLGNHPLWEALRIGYNLFKRPFVLRGAALGLGYFSGFVRRIDRPVSKELMRFHRREEMQKLRSILAAMLRLKRPDSFRALPNEARARKT
jgi:glycosyltransferase involved in cell wall biosynthesis